MSPILVRDFRTNSVTGALALATLAFVLAAPALPQDLFPLRRYDTGGAEVTALAVGDLNADGLLDIAASNHDTSTAGILFARPGGGFEDAWSFFAGNGITDLAIADFDLDGRNDFVAVNEFGAFLNVGLLPASGLTWWNIGGMHGGRALDVGDIDGDGDVDVVTADIGTSTISVLLGAGAGGVAGPVSYPTGTDPLDVVLADFDGDGDLDVASVSQVTDAVSVLRDVGAGVLAPPVTHPVGNNPRQLAAADLDGDGDMDLAVSTTDTSGLSLLFGDGAGGFAPAQSLPFGGWTDELLAADVNADGLVDLVAAANAANVWSFATRLGSGGGGFGPVIQNGSQFLGGISDGVPNDYPTALALDDADRDGRLDLLIATPSVAIFPGDGEGGFESVLKAGVASPDLVASGDVDGDGSDDLVLADENGTSVRLADGQGTWGDPVPLGFTSIGFLHLLDENGDGDLDLLTTAYLGGFPPTISLRIADGDGRGGFGAPVDHPLEWRAVLGGEPVDLDSDGDLDLALLTYAGATFFSENYYLTTVINQGGYSFATPVDLLFCSADTQQDPFPPRDPQLKLADADGDGDLDYFLRTVTFPLFPGGNLDWVANDGAGGTTTGGSQLQNVISGFALGDLNLDGWVDVAMTYYQEVRVCLGSAGGFAAPLTIGAGSDKDLHIADIDQDGRPDIVVGAATVFRSLATGGFERSNYFADMESDFFADLVLDADGDGWQDVLGFTSSTYGTPGRVLLNHVLLSAWKDLGHGLAGVFGEPKLVGQGKLQSGTPGTLTLTNANPNKLAVLFIGATANPTPFKGGLLVPVPPAIMFTLFTSPAGTITVGWSSWKLMPPGTDWFFQYGIVDAAAPAGASLSNAVRALQP